MEIEKKTNNNGFSKSSFNEKFNKIFAYLEMSDVF